MPGTVDPAHAPVPRNAAERLVFAQLYETLVRLDCEGRTQPGLAAAWRVEEDGRRWTFTLRADARDWTGAPVTAQDVAASWLAAERAARHAGAPGADGLLAPGGDGMPGAPMPRFTSLAALDARTLRAELAEPVPLRSFALPELAVRTSARVGPWPAGTGPHRPEHGTGTDATPAPPSSGPLQRLVLRPAAEGSASIEFRATAGDPRNALDRGVDMLVTRDPGVADYAVGSGAFQALPLAWDRVYVLVAAGSGARVGSVRAPAGQATRLVLPPAAALQALARDAVRADARPAGVLREPAEHCGVLAEHAAAGSGSTGAPGAPAAGAGQRAGVVFPPGDPVARALAERLVALALAAGPGGAGADAAWLADVAPALAAAGARARVVDPGSDARYAAALRAGGAAAYVVPLEVVAGRDPCELVAALVERAPWLGESGRGPAAGAPGGASPAGDDAPRIAPLIETRPLLIVRRGIAGVAVDGSGMLVLDRLRRAVGGER
ncbi:MAG TPA: ABC transporter substrate-binding protein [Longimicrobiales bacterium]